MAKKQNLEQEALTKEGLKQRSGKGKDASVAAVPSAVDKDDNGKKKGKAPEYKTEMDAGAWFLVALGVFMCLVGLWAMIWGPEKRLTPDEINYEILKRINVKNASLTAEQVGKQITTSDVIRTGAWWNLTCESEFTANVEGCTPSKNCGRFVMDDFLTNAEIRTLNAIADRGMAHGIAEGGPSIFDLVTGAVTYKNRFLSVYNRIATLHAEDPKKNHPFFLSARELDLIIRVYDKIFKAITKVFHLENSNKLSLSSPSFFSRIDSNEPLTPHDDYTHVHVDADQYKTFCYTGLVYLSDGEGVDFEGGEFVWLDENNKEAAKSQKVSEAAKRSEHPLAKTKTLEHSVVPRKGRLSLFTSGNENLHHVKKVTKGVRRALTVAFTCDEEANNYSKAGGGVKKLLEKAWKRQIIPKK
ncbi:2-oxoglutarate and iron-dependent oxygenase domain-containing protein 3 [Chytridiales sp. JEL 0842]|nr:2-oxoglutarate and iron-dependent oxygenase domain-containing protein 3 [Chytridiales sp. JEL 0842]